ncbi:protein of unknown function [Xenorhabdus poinarii G6]|uniref:Uncharacterized protein n=1 Tax=Xenorhabdus poinarii G6 TaxID=1354304 RepID=A0A068R1U9_9GAMM|nr:protein of unknown function [Xenorhabdus poinarii G6]
MTIPETFHKKVSGNSYFVLHFIKLFDLYSILIDFYIVIKFSLGMASV